MRILVVDDEPVSRRVVEAALRSFGHLGEAAVDGLDAWRRFQAEPYDVVISDRDMPGLSGMELCRLIREHPAGRRAYIVMVTSLDRREDVLEGVSAGADDYLIKPLDIGDLQLRLIAAERIVALHRQIEEMNDELERAARTDVLTGVGNRLALNEALALLHARLDRYGGCYSLALLDVDNFKSYNDTLGHLAGDRALAVVAQVLADGVRQGDAVYRYGGEEFVCVLPMQVIPGATSAMERLRAALHELELPHPRSARGIVTASAGLVSYRGGSGHSPDDVLLAADAALYRAKEAGRDTIVSTELPAVEAGMQKGPAEAGPF